MFLMKNQKRPTEKRYHDLLPVDYPRIISKIYSTIIDTGSVGSRQSCGYIKARKNRR